ncbi:MAG: uroporphyrinogen decarboxylase family protein [Planctomycetota bacterium]
MNTSPNGSTPASTFSIPYRSQRRTWNLFWGGGCDTQHVLPLGTPEQVREHVRHNLEVFSKDSGFVFTQVHNIQQNVPPENVEAMFQAAYEWR